MPGLEPSQSEVQSLFALYRQGRLPEAEAGAAALTARYPNSSNLQLFLGNLSFARGRLDLAEAYIARAVMLAPGNAEAHNNLGIVLTAAGRLTEAMAAFRQALSVRGNYADALANLANVLQKLGSCKAAVETCQRALAVDPASAAAHDFMGNALLDLGEIDGAIASYRRALSLQPDGAAIHSNLAEVLVMARRLDEAVAASREALRLAPDFPPAHKALGDALRGLGRWHEAAHHYEKGSSPEAHAQALECHWDARDDTAFDSALAALAAREPHNIRAAAIAAFVAEQRGCDNPFPFCRTPLALVAASDMSGRFGGSFPVFVDGLLEDLGNLDAVWEPPGQATKGGAQTTGNLFTSGSEKMAVVERVIRSEIEAFRAARRDIDAGFITHWPERNRLAGWHVRLKCAGHQEAHIHPGGWLSGVLYLRLPSNLHDDEGAIRFSLHGYGYRLLNQSVPVRVHRPKAAELVLFPSSLFHETVPFACNEERHSLAFDLEPLS